ncbi:MAG: 30S ribosomal protein S6 [Dehalogenimonas sp.]|jgi:small subunit ribosomal protein S6|uniref:Small ribosomal subunit protein bS6 n=1 Tax=Candidatus Dehalogenimonas loeffleri TaxID=3127115 RepID=A0ABZ2J4F3_9CHLR|nr:30S ribosomal protein S6 [Dehalogenimonas sp.]
MTELLRSRTEPVSSYELVVIYRQELPQEKIDVAVEHISNMITANGGVVDAVDRWGKRRLAYPIKQQLEGVYVLFKFTAGSSVVRKLTDDLRISESVLRHMAIKPDA